MLKIEKIKDKQTVSFTDIMLDKKIYKNLKIARAFYHRRHGIIIELDNKQQPGIGQKTMQSQEQSEGVEKTLLLISNIIIEQNLPSIEPKIFKIPNLTIPITAQYQPKLCMKCAFQEEEYLFFFEDLIDNKGSFAALYDAGHLIKVQPMKKIAEASPNLLTDHEQFCDFIATVEKSIKMHQVAITDVDISIANEFISYPLITFVTHDCKRQEEKNQKVLLP